MMILGLDLEITTCKAILDRIKARAIDRWGEKKWLAEMVKKYCQMAKTQGDETATPVNRRPQIERAFERGTCTADTLILLAATVNGRFQLVFTIEEVEEL
jgi:hypothetical protein